MQRSLPVTRRRAVLASLARAGLPCAARAEAGWRIVTEYPATAMPGEGVAYFAQAASTAGFPVQPGFDAPDGLRSAAMLAAVAAGRVAAADAFTGALAA